MPAISEEKNREHVANTAKVKTRAYKIVRLLAARAGYLENKRDTAGIIRFMDSFHGDEVDWFEAIDELAE